MDKIIFKKETMNEQLPETLYAVESHMGGIYFEDVDLDVDDDYSCSADDPYYCEMCGGSDWPLGPIDTPLELLALLVERYDYREDIRKMSDEDIAKSLERLVVEGGEEIVVDISDYDDALQALIEYRESEKQNAGGESLKNS
ncbi:hypothetical protein [Fructobacillus fructosus]|uniref:hypothetical protein n=1 Tax=Fructobacillus fructosus TaxID=1631 RepID=UPI002DA91125|nr:unnamed protein product [Fructobacillus fructosus]CAK1236096.1 unnamed protein product [Fructobacillus fructosus]CAK1237377.1 unnamed protein product [Fructobacillus fructosus]